MSSKVPFPPKPFHDKPGEKGKSSLGEAMRGWHLGGGALCPLVETQARSRAAVSLVVVV